MQNFIMLKPFKIEIQKSLNMLNDFLDTTENEKLIKQINIIKYYFLNIQRMMM